MINHLFQGVEEIIEYSTKDNVISREQHYLDLEKPLYNICKKAGSSLGRVTRESTRLKLKQGWLIRNFKNKANGMSFSEFVLDLPPPPIIIFLLKK